MEIQTDMLLSIIICSHNPRPEYLRRTLDAMKAQTLPQDLWELLLIDNASAQPLADHWDLSWHAAGRHIREDQLGLTHARLRGIRESAGDVIVFVDDDNLLAPDFLEKCIEIEREFPKLGAWGGQLVGEFEVAPPEWATPYLNLIAVRTFDKDVWASTCTFENSPYGAGLCCRRIVADAYHAAVTNDPRRAGLDRVGGSLAGCGDLDLAFTSGDLGYGCGIFTRLNLTHIIPARRVTREYLLKLTESGGASVEMLAHIRGENVMHRSVLHRILFWLRVLRLPRSHWHRVWIDARGRRSARKWIAASKRPSAPPEGFYKEASRTSLE